MIVLCIYIIIPLSFININSSLIIMYIIEYLIIFLIVDQLEQNFLNKLFKQIREKPSKKIYNKSFNVVDNYCNLENSITSQNMSSNEKKTNIDTDINMNFIFIKDIYRVI